MKNRLHQECYARSCQEIGELKRRFDQEENAVRQRKLEEFNMQHDQESRTVSLLRDQVRKLPRTIGVYWRFENLPRCWLIEQFWQCPRSASSSYHLEFQKAEPRIENAAKYTKRFKYSRKFFWLSTCSTSAWGITQWFEKFGNTIGNSEKRRNWEKWERRTIAINTFTLLVGKSKGKKSGRQKLSYVCDQPCRGYWDLYSRWHDNSELSFLGDASGEIPWPYGISELDCKLPNRGLLEGEESHARFAMDQGNRISQIAGWPRHSEVNKKQKFPWLWRIGFDDGGSIKRCYD